MRIALVDPLAYTPPYDHHLARALARRGHDVTLLTSEFLHGEAPGPEGYRREEVFLPLSARLLRGRPRARARLALKGLEYVPGTRRMLRRIRDLDPDVVHVQWLPRPELDVRWVRRLGRPTALTAHDVVPRRERATPAWREALGLVDRVIVHSQRAAEQLQEFQPEVIRHPVFEAAPLGPPHGKTLLFFGLIREYKGLDVLLRALPRIPEARLVVAGDPLDPVEPLRRVAPADRVEWRLRFIDEPEVAELMERAAVVVLPYRKLDSSGVLATAIGYRRPAVVSDVGSLGEIVAEFGAGLVVPPGDEAALAAACSSLLGDEQALAQAYEGAARAAASLTWDAAAQEHERVYDAIRGTNRRSL
ncbi:MAG TPA: glycosyltransferase family 4 protein [Gaiellaceae bacterium]|nr:glycosyltransferase family 4 protein [Gaiellaceae bacterium]